MAANPFDDDATYQEATATETAATATIAPVPACESSGGAHTSSPIALRPASPGSPASPAALRLDAKFELAFGDVSTASNIRAELERRVRFSKEVVKRSTKLAETVRKVEARGASLSELLNGAISSDLNAPFGTQALLDRVCGALGTIADELQGPSVALNYGDLAGRARDAMTCIDTLERRRREVEGSRRALDKQAARPNADAGRLASSKKRLMEAEHVYQQVYQQTKSQMTSMGREFPASLSRCVASLAHSELSSLGRAVEECPDTFHGDIRWLVDSCPGSASDQAVAIGLCSKSNALMKRMSAFKRVDFLQNQVRQLVSVNEDLNRDARARDTEARKAADEMERLRARCRELEASNEKQRRRSISINEEKDAVTTRLEESLASMERMQQKIAELEEERMSSARDLEEKGRIADAGVWQKNLNTNLTMELAAMRRELESYKAAMAAAREGRRSGGAIAGHTVAPTTNPFDDATDDSYMDARPSGGAAVSGVGGSIAGGSEVPVPQRSGRRSRVREEGCGTNPFDDAPSDEDVKESEESVHEYVCDAQLARRRAAEEERRSLIDGGASALPNG